MNVKDNNNNTPLHEAVVHGNEEAVILLLNFKPYPSVKNMFAGILFHCLWIFFLGEKGALNLN